MLVTQSCPALCNPMDCSLPGSSVHEILQARILEWIAISFYRGSSWPRDQTWVSCMQADALPSELLLLLSHFSRVQLCATLWTVAHQAPLSMGFFRQEHWSRGCHALLQEIFSTLGSNLCLMSPALSGRFFTTSASWEVQKHQLNTF